MIITRTPLRVSIGGGGTDLPSYYRRFGGSLISAAIDKYVFIGINKTFSPGYQIKYSRFEQAASIAEIHHPIVREALRLHDVPPSLEIISLADIPAGTGLGSSGTFTVGLVRALYALQHKHVTSEDVAREACRIEIDLLNEPVGKQDQYIASYGGMTCFEFLPDDSVKVTPLKLAVETRSDLEENLLLFFTGYSRTASEILGDQVKRTISDEAAVIDNLHYTKELGQRIKTALETGHAEQFGRMMHEHWEVKKRRSGNMSSDIISRWYDVGRNAGAVGGKLVGAGGGGFLMFYTHDRTRLRAAMAVEGLAEVPFRFDYDGSMTIFRG